jgi:hypothetical protein
MGTFDAGEAQEDKVTEPAMGVPLHRRMLPRSRILQRGRQRLDGRVQCHHRGGDGSTVHQPRELPSPRRGRTVLSRQRLPTAIRFVSPPQFRMPHCSEREPLRSTI